MLDRGRHRASRPPHGGSRGRRPGRRGPRSGAARAGHRVTGAYAGVRAEPGHAPPHCCPASPCRTSPTIVADAELVLLDSPRRRPCPPRRRPHRHGAWQAGQIVVHTSGRHGVGVLEAARAHHVLPLALHPAMTFTGTAMDLDPAHRLLLRRHRTASRCARSPRRSSSRWAPTRCGSPRRTGPATTPPSHTVPTTSSRSSRSPWRCSRRPASSEPHRVIAPLLRAALDNALRLGDACPHRAGRARRCRYRGRAPARAGPARARDVRRTYVALARATAARALATAAALGLCRAEPLLDVLAAPGARDRRPRHRPVPRTARRRPHPRRAAGRTQRPRAAARRRRDDDGRPARRATRELIRRRPAAVRRSVVVTIFLNPLQFGPGEDLSRYPRTFDADLALCAREGVDLVFAAHPGRRLPGRRPRRAGRRGRPGRRARGPVPARALRRRADRRRQAAAPHRRPTAPTSARRTPSSCCSSGGWSSDLDFPVEVVPVPTVREPDGLALSSRNTYLTPSDREVGAGPVAGAAGRRRGRAVEGPSAVRRAARAVLVREPLVLVDYLVLVHPATLEDVPEWYRGEALLAVAGRVGTTRLIDNMPVARGPRRRGARRLLRAGPHDRDHRERVMTLTIPSRLAAPEPGWTISADVIVVGSGIAGLTAALRLRQRVDRVLLVTKTVLSEGSTEWAQGGIAAALDPADSPEEHLRDTLVAGVGLCDVAAVRALVDRGPGAGARAGRPRRRVRPRPGRRDLPDPRGRPPPRPDRPRRRRRHRSRRSPGRSSPRCTRFSDDPGIEVRRARARRRPAHGRRPAPSAASPCTSSARARSTGSARRYARAVVLATGGLGQVFSSTTNPSVATGDGVAAALRAGAVVTDLEFVQFHPTVLWLGEGATRPAAADLRGGPRRGRRARRRRRRAVHAGRAPDGRPRPAGRRGRARSSRGCARPAPTTSGWTPGTWAGTFLEARFPSIVARCRELGFDPATELLPVAPAQHYACGGVETDLLGRSSLDGPVRVRRGAPAPACTAPTGWPPTRCSRGSSSRHRIADDVTARLAAAASCPLRRPAAAAGDGRRARRGAPARASSGP